MKKAAYRWIAGLVVFSVAVLLVGFAAGRAKALETVSKLQSSDIYAAQLQNATSSCPIESQDTVLLEGNEWVPGTRLLSLSKKSGESASFGFRPERPGLWQVEVFLAKSASSGIVKLYLNDRLAAENVDLFSPEGSGIALVRLGEHRLESTNTLRIEVSGCNLSSAKPYYQWGFERIRIKEPAGFFTKILSGQRFAPAVCEQLSIEDMRFLDEVDRGEVALSERASATQRVLGLLKKTTSRELRGQIYYASGRYHFFYTQDYYTSLRLLKKALKICPEIYGDPAKSGTITYIETCQGLLAPVIMKRLIQAVLIVLILILIALYVITKPWRWITLQQCVLLAVLIAGAAALFFLVDFFTSKMDGQVSSHFSQPIYSNEQLEGFGRKIRLSVLQYYLAGFVCMMLAVIPLSGIRLRFTRVALTLLVALILFPGVIGLFCFRQSGTDSYFSTLSFRLNTDEALPHLTGSWFWLAKDFKPYVISNPRKFMNLNVDLSNEPVFKDWLIEKYSRIKSTDASNEK